MYNAVMTQHGESIHKTIRGDSPKTPDFGGFVDLEINERFLKCFLLGKGVRFNTWGQKVPPICTPGDVEVLGSVVIRVPGHRAP